jgi:hypothetical protein
MVLLLERSIIRQKSAGYISTAQTPRSDELATQPVTDLVPLARRR